MPVAEIFQWRKFALALLAAGLALATLHATLRGLPRRAGQPVRGAGACSPLVYATAARFILRDEYGYVMRAFTRRRAAT